MKCEWKGCVSVAGVVNKNLPSEIFSVSICQRGGEHSGDLDDRRATRSKRLGPWVNISSSSHGQILLAEDMNYIGLIH